MDKQCIKCREFKSVELFNKDKHSFHGTRYECKSCEKEYKKKYYLENKRIILEQCRQYYIANSDKVKLRVRLYRQTEKGRMVKMEGSKKYFKSEKGLITRKKYLIKNRKKQQSRSAVARALRGGGLTKEGCRYVNGKCQGRVEAHHWDYDKQLEVTWFCKKHHTLVDIIQKLKINYGLS